MVVFCSFLDRGNSKWVFENMQVLVTSQGWRVIIPSYNRICISLDYAFATMHIERDFLPYSQRLSTFVITSFSSTIFLVGVLHDVTEQRKQHISPQAWASSLRSGYHSCDQSAKLMKNLPWSVGKQTLVAYLEDCTKKFKVVIADFNYSTEYQFF